MSTVASPPSFAPFVPAKPPLVEIAVEALPHGEEPEYEIVRGVKVELPPMSTFAGIVASRLQDSLGHFVRANRLGVAVSEVLFVLDSTGDYQRKPDVAFVSAQRWPPDREIAEEGDGWAVVPDLAVEVISPTDRFETVHDKVAEYLRFGVRQVWLVLPRLRQIHIHDGSKATRWLDVADTLDGGELLPDYRLSLEPLFSRRIVPA